MASIRGLVRTARQTRILAKTTSTATLAPQQRCGVASTAASTPLAADAVFQDLEPASSLETAPLAGDVRLPTPAERAMQRRAAASGSGPEAVQKLLSRGGRLPGARYQYHPPKYDRGPLHPVQSPASSDPVARDFVPGPFYLPRLRQTYQSTVAADLMTLGYVHEAPKQGAADGADEADENSSRLRGWDGSSPYHKNRPPRGPRGGRGQKLPLLERPLTFRNIPEIRSVTLAAFEPLAAKSPDRLVVARMALQAITGKVPEVTRVRHNVAQWGIIKGQKAGVKVTVYGSEAYELLDKCVHLVFPRIKEWQGVKGSSGDSSGNLAWGLSGDELALFPEIEVNHTMYPAKTIPGCRVFVETTATSDRQARLLLSALGVPFYGELRD